MADPFVGEIKIWGFNWAPKGWALCNGAILPITQNQALFSLIGVQFGGNGTTNFQLPDLRSRVPVGATIGAGPPPGLSNYIQGEVGGVETVPLTSGNFPTHNHLVQGVNTKGTTIAPAGMILASTTPVNTTSTLTFQIYAGSWTAGAVLNSQTVGMDGGNLPHVNVQPYSAVNFSIALTGIYPSRN